MIEFTQKERFQLSLQFQILERLVPEEADYFSRVRAIVEHGYEYHYDELVEYIYDGDDKMTREECSEVLEILSMFDAINIACQRHPNAERDANWARRFWGFDGNNEGKQLGYAQFFIERLQRFVNLPRRPGLDGFNSHMPTLETYRRMLDIWRAVPLDERYANLGIGIVDAILAGAVHPEQRGNR